MKNDGKFNKNAINMEINNMFSNWMRVLPKETFEYFMLLKM